MKYLSKKWLYWLCVLHLTGCGSSSGGNQNSASPASSVASSSASSLISSSKANVIPNYKPAAAAIPSTGISLPVGKCVNMGNMLDAPKEGDWGRAILDSDAAKIKAAGFQTVRLPVRFAAHTAADMPYTINPTFLARVRHVVDTLTAAGLNVMLDYHYDDALMASVSENTVRFTEIWKQIADEFASAPPSVWFELLNEPNGNATDANLSSLWQPAINAIRTTNPTRPIIVGGQNWSEVNSLNTIQIPNDPYIVVTFHYYLPFAYTHQGATWVSPSPSTGRKFGSQADAVELANSLQTVQDFMKRTGRVPFVGEYGTTLETVSPTERAEYFKVITSAFASIGIQSCAWSYINAWPIATESGWVEGMLESISTTTTLQ
jgi:endoglucanase